MKTLNKLKGFVAGVLLLGGMTIASYGANQSTTVATANTLTSLFPTNQIVITKITVANTSSTNMSIVFYDTALATLTNYVGPYNSVASYLTNISFIFTNFVGVLTTNTYTNALYTYTNTIALHTNTAPVVVSMAVNTNSTISYTPVSGGISTSFGLAVSNNVAPAAITVEYFEIR